MTALRLDELQQSAAEAVAKEIKLAEGEGLRMLEGPR